LIQTLEKLHGMIRSDIWKLRRIIYKSRSPKPDEIKPRHFFPR